MTDAQFDALEDSLKSIDSSNEWFKRGVNDSTPKKRKVKLPYPMMSLNKFKTIETLKEWMKSFPESTFIITPKFSETGTAIIKDVELNVNRHGVITPVAILEEPIFLSGASINRVSAINMNYVSLWGIIPGEKVTIVRSGEVIPKIIAVNDIFIPFRETYNKVGDYLIDYNNNATNRHFQMKKGNITILEHLTVCPKCGTKLKELVNESGDWCEMYCPNNNCHGRKIETAIKFFSICQIDGFGDKKIAKIANEFIKSDKPIFFELLNVDENFLIQFEGWAEISVKSYLNECNKIKNNLPFSRFLHATGWFGELGEKTLQKIIDSDGWDMPIEQLITIEGIQNKTAITFLAGKQMYYTYESYIKENFKFDYVKTLDNKKDGKLNDLVICMTGFRDKLLTSQITELGGTVLDSVTKNVNCVVTKDKNSNSSKINKAKKMGLEILDIEEFKEKYIKN